MKFQSTSLLLFSALLAGCATAGGGRERLSSVELQSLRPAIAEHARCLADRMSRPPSAAETRSVSDAAAQDCRDRLAMLATDLEALNLSKRAQARYLDEIGTTTVEVVARRLQVAPRLSSRPAPAQPDGSHPSGE